MRIYDELVDRGLIAQVTDEEEIKELINSGKATFYIEFDPTADSLYVGHFMALRFIVKKFDFISTISTYLRYIMKLVNKYVKVLVEIIILRVEFVMKIDIIA